MLLVLALMKLGILISKKGIKYGKKKYYRRS